MAKKVFFWMLEMLFACVVIGAWFYFGIKSSMYGW